MCVWWSFTGFGRLVCCQVRVKMRATNWMLSHPDNMTGLDFMCKVRSSDTALVGERAGTGTLSHVTRSHQGCVCLVNTGNRTGECEQEEFSLPRPENCHVDMSVSTNRVFMCMDLRAEWSHWEVIWEDMSMRNSQSDWANAGSFLNSPPGWITRFCDLSFLFFSLGKPGLGFFFRTVSVEVLTWMLMLNI